MKSKKRFIIDVELESQDYDNVEELHGITYDSIQDAITYLINPNTDDGLPFDPEAYRDVIVIDCPDVKVMTYRDFLEHQVLRILKGSHNFNDNDKLNNIFSIFEIKLDVEEKT